MTPVGTPYRAGDRIVTFAPGARGEIVTYECGTVLAVDVNRGELVATMDDGRIQHFGPDEVGPDHLAHGYAVTVHRSQGATVGSAHVLEDGGGRELAYVKISRARERTTLYPVADSVEQAAEDLMRDWAVSRRLRWAIDTGTPVRDPELAEGSPQVAPEILTALRHARLVAEHDALVASVPNDWRERLFAVDEATLALRGRRQELERGTGVYADTAVGAAARELVQARTASPGPKSWCTLRSRRGASTGEPRGKPTSGGAVRRPPPTAGSDWPALSSPAWTARTKHWPMTATTFVTG